MSKRMFEQGEVSWPEEAPFHTPVYVLTQEKRDPWVRPGGTTFYFINEGPERALAPVLFGGGRRLFENLSEPMPQFRIDTVLDGSNATHLRYIRK